MERDPSRVAPHHLDDHDAMVRLSGRVQAIDRVGRECHGGVEAEAGGRADDIVVDCLGHADHGDAALTELLRDRQGAVAADDDDRVEPHLVEHLDDAIGIIVRALGCLHGVRERVAAIGGAENRPAESQDAGDIARRERARPIGFNQSVEAVLQADAVDPGIRRGLHDRADDGVQPGRVAAAGEHADPSDLSQHLLTFRTLPRN